MSGLSPRQRELLEASAAVASRTRRGIEEAAGRPPAAGDVFVLEATAGQPVEWLLLGPAGSAGAFAAVPGDSHPFLGSSDLEVETTAGPLRLRGAASTRLGPETLDSGRRVATIAAGDLARVRGRLHELERAERAEPPDNALLEEVDGSPDYREWLRETILPAVQAAGVRVEPQPARPPARLPGSAAGGARLALAALVFLSVGLGIWALRSQGRLRELAGERGRQTALVESLRARLAAAGRPAPAGPGPRIELPVAILLPDETLRGERAPVPLPSASPFLIVVLRFRESPADRSFRVNLTRQGEATALWNEDGIPRAAEGGVQLALPRHLLPPGVYRLRLSSLGNNGRAEERGDFRLEIAP
jgi:hypothetical protein